MHYLVYSVLGVCSTPGVQYSVYAVLSVCSNRWVKDLVYAVLVYALLNVNSWSWHGEIERDDLTWCSSMMVELRIRKREMRGDQGKHHKKQELKRIWYVGQLTMPDTAGMSPDTAGLHTNSRYSNPHQESCTPDVSYLLITSISFPSLSSNSLFCPQLYHHCKTQS